MNHFTNQSNGSHRGHSLMGRAMLRRFALFFPMILLMLLFLPAGMVAKTEASSSKYIATYDSDTETLTFEKYEGESLPENSAWVVDKKKVFAIIGNVTIKHIVFDKSFSTYTPTSLYCFFENLTKLETITGLEYLNTAKVTNMSSMFSRCSSLASLDVTHFNTAKVTNMSSMFSRCSSLASLDVTHFNTANVTNMRNMFSGCSSLTSLDVTHFNTANVTDMSYMFSSCSSLTSLDVTYFNTENVTNMSTMFSSCSSLTSLDVTKFNTANVTDMYRMFKSCGLTSLDLSNFNTAKVTNMELMFSGCSNLKTIYASDKFITAAVTKSENMFSYCGSLSGDIDWSDKATDKTYAKIDGGYFRDKAYDNRPWVKYADGTLTFRCGYKKTLGENEYLLNSDEELPKWNTHNTKISKVVFEASFANARPTSCYAWFQNFIKLKQIEGIENLNTENVTNMKFMFKGCSSLTSLDVTHFNTGNVTSMSGMFDGCSGLISLDVTNFNTANVTDMSKMFFCCYKLKEIYVSDKFVTDDVISSEYMFMGCNSLSGDIDWKSVKVSNKTYAKTAGGYFRDKAYDNRPWVKYADGTLTFRCGYKKTLGENEYLLNSDEELPKWNTPNNNINLVVFYASFANARPKSCYAWFQGFENLKQIKGIENLNTENVTSMKRMFSNCSNLAELDVTNFNTANVTDMSYMFSNCRNLTTIYVSDEFVITNITHKNYNLFFGCIKLKGAIEYIEGKTNYKFANYKTGYFTKLVGKNGDEKIGAAGKTLATENLALDDDKDFVAYEPFAAKAASYSRTMKEGTTWATLCLPFDVSLANQNFRAFKLLSADEGTETVELEEIETNIAAGTPVIIKMKDGANSLSISEAEKAIAKDVQTSKADNGNYQLQGLYTQKVFSKDADNNCYIVKGDKLMNPAKLLDKTTTEHVGSKPFRAYMVDNSSAPAAGARMFSISVGGSTTAIEQLETTADSKAEYYDLQGRRLQDLQKGINIVKRGGKTMKVIIK